MKNTEKGASLSKASAYSVSHPVSDCKHSNFRGIYSFVIVLCVPKQELFPVFFILFCIKLKNYL